MTSGRSHLRRFILGGGSLLIIAFAASSAYDVWRAYAQVTTATARELTTLSKALAEEAAREFQSVDIMLRETAAWYRTSTRRTASDAADKLAAYASGLPVLSLVVRDAKGMRRYSWFASGTSPDHVPDQHRVSALPGGTQRGDSIASGVDERGNLVLSRTVTSAGRSIGVVSTVIHVEDFSEFYSAIDIGAGNTILLLSESGVLLARQPAAAHAIGKAVPEIVAQKAQATRDQDARLIVSPIDGAQRFVAVASVRGYPFLIGVTREKSVALSAWTEQTVHVAARTMILSLLTALLITQLVQQLARLDAAESEKQRLEAQLRQSQKMEAVGTLAGGIAHDFNNILGAILGFSELAQKNVMEGSAVRRYLDQVVQAGVRAKRLVEGILAFSRSGVGERVPVHVQSIVEEALELLLASLPAHVRLEKKLDANEAAVIGDPTQVHQVVMNLCTNAVQAMEHGGVLTVILEQVPLHETRVLSHGTLAPGLYVRLSVADTGSGIPEIVLERMFDPFFTTKGVGEGTGLGLSLVHGITADLGGAIDVATQIGEGTTFAIWLPAAGETAKTVAHATRELPRGNGETVMIVDDEPALVMLGEETLAELDYEPAGFESSVAALRAFQDDPGGFDLVVTDETMPDMSGIELAREIHQLRPDVPIILMSGYSGTQLIERAHAAGVREVLRKPLVSRDIAEALAHALSTRR